MTGPPLDVWLIAGTSRFAIYPCRCVLGRRCQSRCFCRGRTDGHLQKPHCCGYRTRTNNCPPIKTEEPTR